MPSMQTVHQPQIQQHNVQQIQQQNLQNQLNQLNQLNQSQVMLQGSGGTIKVLGQNAAGQVSEFLPDGTFGLELGIGAAR